MCVAAPRASGAAGDAAEAAFRRKLRRYRREIPQPSAAGIAFRPLVWTANGRPHPAVTSTLAFAAAMAANRSDSDAQPRALLGRWRHEIQIAIQRRRAAMMRAVLPRASSSATWLLTGHSGALPCDAGRAAPLRLEELVEGLDETAERFEESAFSDGSDAGSETSGRGGG